MTAASRPYLRSAGSTNPLHPGWSTHPAGRFDNVDVEVAFDPRRHDVCHALTPLAAEVAAGIATHGWRLHAALDGGRELWVRERPAASRARLTGLRCLAGTQVHGR